ncbi:unnamed protein product [Didymodactylos carnosus]|uniref:Ankyrin repeat-containing protein n=1 Tax=Didymodactylos carnosus TaxID=1234261 RepID=A0A814APQ9_9BILA|nr:unnamed protein product [Didymodactylos carnosus]CAF0917840.1 unnamed protein product [Didymodactylos carnosus]CAF3543414.1 unnamed protein product [Didymodactylos carnosus]CAF3697719.1 unnamed protein product [Didymodactylos carnosus]
MAKFLQRFFSGGSSSNKSSFRSSQTSLNSSDKSRRGDGGIGGSLQNLSSTYQVKAKDLEKNKLHKASWEGDLHKVQRLMNPGVINVKDKDNRTPLHLAVAAGHLNIVKFLVERKAKLNLADSDQRTPLVKAVLCVNQNPTLNCAIIAAIISGGGDQFINTVDINGKNALHYAVETNRTDLVELFRRQEGCDINFQDRNSQTPLHLAIRNQNLQIIDQLLEADANPDIQDQNGQTPLMFATSLNNIEIVKKLLNAEANTQLLDNQQMSAMDIAKKHRDDNCAQLIIEYDKHQNSHPTKKSTSFNDQQPVVNRYGPMLSPATDDSSSSDDSSSEDETKIKRQRQSVAGEWSDDNTISANKEPQRGIGSLMKNIPLQSQGEQKTQQTLGSLMKNIPLQSTSEQKTQQTLGSLVKNVPLQPSSEQQTQQTLGSLMKNIPLQPQGEQKTQQTLGSLMKNIPLQQPSGQKTQQVNNDNRISTANSQKQSSSIFGIGPISDRISDDTSTSAHFSEKPVVTAKINALVSATPLIPATKTQSYSWSDDDDDPTDKKKPHTIAHVQNKQKSETWDESDESSSSLSLKDKNQIANKSDQSKLPKSVISNLVTTQPFNLNTTSMFKTDQQSKQAYTSDDDDPVEAAIRNMATPRQTYNNKTNENSWSTKEQLASQNNGTTISNLINKNITGGYKVVHPEDTTLVNDDNSWSTSATIPKTFPKTSMDLKTSLLTHTPLPQASLPVKQQEIVSPKTSAELKYSLVHHMPMPTATSPILDASENSWSTSTSGHAKSSMDIKTNLVQHVPMPDKQRAKSDASSTWDDSRPLSADLKRATTAPVPQEDTITTFKSSKKDLFNRQRRSSPSSDDSIDEQKSTIKPNDNNKSGGISSLIQSSMHPLISSPRDDNKSGGVSSLIQNSMHPSILSSRDDNKNGGVSNLNQNSMHSFISSPRDDNKSGGISSLIQNSMRPKDDNISHLVGIMEHIMKSKETVPMGRFFNGLGTQSSSTTPTNQNRTTLSKLVNKVDRNASISSIDSMVMDDTVRTVNYKTTTTVQSNMSDLQKRDAPVMSTTPKTMMKTRQRKMSDNDEQDDDDYPIGDGHDFKLLRQHSNEMTNSYQQQSKHHMHNQNGSGSRMYDTGLRSSVSSSSSSFRNNENIEKIIELREDIRQIEKKQEDSLELKRQLKDMEIKKNNFEAMWNKTQQLLAETETKLDQEKQAKLKQEWNTRNLNNELKTVRNKLQMIEDEKTTLQQRFTTLRDQKIELEDKYDRLKAQQQQNSMHMSNSSSTNGIGGGILREEDIEKIKSRHREEMKLLSLENEDLHQRTKQLQSDLQLHKESLDVTVRYKIDLEKACEEKTYLQQELNRFKLEKDLIEQEKFEYKTKYESLQDEIRLLLFDRSKIEQKLTAEIQEQGKQRTKNSEDIRKYKQQIEQLNIKLGDSEAKMLSLQSRNETLMKSKDMELKSEFDTLTKRLNTIENDQIIAEKRYQNENILLTELTRQQQKQSNDSTVNVTKQQHVKKEHHRHSQHSNESTCSQCDSLQRNYELERQQRLSIEKDNERLRETVQKQQQQQQQQRSIPSQTVTQSKETDVHLLTVENSKQIRSETERVKYELDRLRQDFNLLIDNYDPKRDTETLHQSIDTFRKFYEQEFRQRQLIMEKLTNDNTSRPRTSPSYPVISYSNGGGDYGNHYSHSPSHDHSCPSSRCSCINSELLKERLETAIDTSLADQRIHAIKQFPLRSATTTTTTTNGIGNVSTLMTDCLPSNTVDETDDIPINFLLLGCGDIRHIFHTLSKLNSSTSSRPLYIYIIENQLELYARHLLLLKLLFEKPHEVSIQEKCELFLELYGNLMIRPYTEQYLKEKSKELIELITSISSKFQLNKTLTIDLSLLKYKERDFLEGILKYWKTNETSTDKQLFPANLAWDLRLRQYLTGRYDTRRNAFDWDYNMKLLLRAGVQHLNIHEYQEWRETGVAYHMRQDYTQPNRTLSSVFVFNIDGTKQTRRGYWGDILTGPYISYGVQTIDKNDEMEKKINDKYAKTATDISVYNVTSLLTNLTEKDDNNVNEQRQVKLILLPLNSIDDICEKESYKNIFKVIYLGCSLSHYLKEKPLENIMNMDCNLILELPNYLLDLKQEQIEQLEKRYDEMAKNKQCQWNEENQKYLPQTLKIYKNNQRLS